MKYYKLELEIGKFDNETLTKTIGQYSTLKEAILEYDLFVGGIAGQTLRIIEVTETTIRTSNFSENEKN